MAIIMFEWVAQMGFIGALLVLLWTDSRASSKALRIVASGFLVLTLLSWWAPSFLWPLASGDQAHSSSSLPSPWAMVSLYSHNMAHWFAFFGAGAWLLAVQPWRRDNGA